ncbi:MAG: hypothetical protein ACKO2L_22825, partial [Planctomycetaceae bacterium]
VRLARQSPKGRQSPRARPMLMAMVMAKSKTQPNPKSMFLQWVLAPQVAMDGIASNQANRWANLVHKLPSTI